MTKNRQLCNNCGKDGHLYHNCKMPIMSIGIVAYRFSETNEIEYLMICRRDTLGFIDFIRGKYSIFNKDYILNMMKQMTESEKEMINTKSFDEIWNIIWGSKKISNQYHNEEVVSREKFNALRNGVSSQNDFYNTTTLIKECSNWEKWIEPEWGFPKGRRNFQETDYECAIREFTEETGYDNSHLINIQNILPFEEIFTGSNYKSYKHKYFLANISKENTMTNRVFNNYEVSSIEWKSYDECMKSIRHYNLEKKRMITNINHILNTYKVFFHSGTE
jgi:ADP-ribose pyrophosphatase YjhB (NUDIX family)